MARAPHPLPASPLPPGPLPDPALLAAWVEDARRRTLDLVADLDGGRLLGPRLAILNPPLWELGHVAWFQEKWVLRHASGAPPLRADGDALYDSAAVPHDVRWDLPLPTLAETVAYLDAVRDGVRERLARRGADPALAYFVQLSVFHEDMHGEAFTYTRQTLGYAAPRLTGGAAAGAQAAGAGPLAGDVEVPGGTLWLGARPGEDAFVFDNEKWAHPVVVAPFAIARAAVTQAEFAAFVADGGYRRRELWSAAGWRWREAAGAEAPLYWQREGDGWLRRDFDRWVPLEPHRAMLHVAWHEAEAWCRWAGRRLPTEAEWEAAAALAEPGRLAAAKRRYPWGDEPPAPAQGNLDGHGLGCADVAAHAAGDTPAGCRQLLGNVWEWTASDFLPYPGFAADPYQEYSQPWFATHKVLRGGAWPTRARLLRNGWRNFYTPDRRDVWSGFRTCRADA